MIDRNKGLPWFIFVYTFFISKLSFKRPSVTLTPSPCLFGLQQQTLLSRSNKKKIAKVY